MDEDYLCDLLDYEEDDLNCDLHRLAEEANIQDKGCQAAECMLGDLRDQLDASNHMEFLYSNSTSMISPIDGCQAGKFHSRAKYMRH